MNNRFTEGDRDKLRDLEAVLDDLSRCEVKLKPWIDHIALNNERQPYQRPGLQGHRRDGQGGGGRRTSPHDTIAYLPHLRSQEAKERIVAGEG